MILDSNIVIEAARPGSIEQVGDAGPETGQIWVADDLVVFV
jgi:hypothetical protein